VQRQSQLPPEGSSLLKFVLLCINSSVQIALCLFELVAPKRFDIRCNSDCDHFHYDMLSVILRAIHGRSQVNAVRVGDRCAVHRASVLPNLFYELYKPRGCDPIGNAPSYSNGSVALIPHIITRLTIWVPHTAIILFGGMQILGSRPTHQPSLQHRLIVKSSSIVFTITILTSYETAPGLHSTITETPSRANHKVVTLAPMYSEQLLSISNSCSALIRPPPSLSRGQLMAGLRLLG
jgi:hypothetical protein